MSISRRRKKRGHDSKADSAGMMLTSLMDIFIVLVLYLLVYQGDGIALDPPDHVTLPDSGVDTQPRRSIVITLSDKDVQVLGKSIVPMSTVLASNELEIQPVREAIEQIKADAL